MSIDIQIKKEDQLEINCKRFYLPVKIDKVCRCGNKLELDFNYDYLSNPTIEKKETISLYCEECDDHATDVNITLSLSVRVD